jgi:hypothetical protein
MNRRTRILLTIIVSACMNSHFADCQHTRVGAEDNRIVFTDITSQAGIKFEHTSSQEKRYILESMSGGVALFDYDNDGWLDIYFVNSCTVASVSDPHCARSALYHNNHDGTFTDVTEASGLGYPGFGMGVCTADIDGDGFEDVYVTGFGGNHLYHNNGNGTFTDITDKAGVKAGGWSTGCAFADYDRDGKLDLFVSRYVHFDPSHLPEFGSGMTCQYRGVAVQCGPRGLQGEGDLLFHNNGDGTFTEVAKAAGVSDDQGLFGLGVAWFDYDQDGWPDLFVANDSGPNYLYHNLRNGKFEEVGFASGTALSSAGNEQGSMGVAVGDYDAQGRFSLFVSNFAEQGAELYRNDGDGSFSDVSFAAGIAAPSLPYVKWGTAFFDYDNDGWPDIFEANGHVYPQVQSQSGGASESYLQRKLLYHNNGNGSFSEVAAQHEAALTVPRSSRGVAFGDLFNEGDIDIVINNIDGTPNVLRNDGGNRLNWLLVHLIGKGMNRSAIGAVVHVRTGQHTQMGLVQSGSSYLSQSDKRLHFGLGTASFADRVDVTWPDGTVTTLEHVTANQIIEIRQPPG